jgi:hypothetical protein
VVLVLDLAAMYIVTIKPLFFYRETTLQLSEFSSGIRLVRENSAHSFAQACPQLFVLSLASH